MYLAVSTTLFDAYGNKRVELSSATGNAYAGDWVGYKGQWGYYTDGESELIYCKNRYYDPVNARWITRDPIGLDGGVNVYAYVDGNPISGVDPDGLRDLTKRDIYLIGRMYNPKFWSKAPGKKIDVSSVNFSVQQIKKAIANAKNKDRKDDPYELKAVLWALEHLGDEAWGGTKAVAIPGWQTNTAASKCNYFVAAAFVVGGGATNFPGRNRFPFDPYQAYGSNAMASGMRLDHALVIGSSLQDTCFDIRPGDMLFFAAGDIGHSTISLGGSLLIYRGSLPSMGTISQNINGHNFYTVRRYKQ